MWFSKARAQFKSRAAVVATTHYQQLTGFLLITARELLIITYRIYYLTTDYEY
ncbi:hypothetical protein [Scytonema hofmannii]|uniref:hypothetical protein n=1 Tax=Scytonema hofmannii TaxID=34078 RepID=UPI00034BBB42|nr:hypothetical protein [Scytonema hofmannii]